MHKISTFLWFNNQAEEAVEHYLVGVYKNSRNLDSTIFLMKVPNPPEKS